MNLEYILGGSVSNWLEGEGPASDVVLSSRIRLARNIRSYPFPTRLDSEGAEKLLQELQAILPDLLKKDQGNELAGLRMQRLADVPELGRQVLVEHHLISPHLARKSQGAAFLIGERHTVSIMINEEDHLRIQCLLPAFQLEQAWQIADRVDNAFESRLKIAFDEQWGYLTTCPTNTGTGMRASVMIHLPGMVLSGQVQPLLSTLSKVGVVVRGLYGEGSEAFGNIFQVSNQLTLGQSEAEILRNLGGVCKQLIDRERNVRQKLYQDNKLGIEDRVSRAYGILTNARVLSFREAIALLSDMRLGIDLNILSHIDKKVFHEMLVQTRPASLQYRAGQELTAEERDVRRASQIRQAIARATKRFQDPKEA